MHRSVWRLFAALLLALAVLPLSAVGAHAATYTITGKVTGLDANGAVVPVANAAVFPYPAGEDSTLPPVMTTSTGTYSLTVPNAGAWQLFVGCVDGTACQETYLREWYDGAREENREDATTINVTSTATANITLDRFQTYSGKVTNTAGTALSGIRVEAGNSSATTDAQGMYSLGGVSPGPTTLQAYDSSGNHVYDTAYWADGTSSADWVETTAVIGGKTTANFTMQRSTGVLVTARDANGAAIPDIETVAWTYHADFGGWHREPGPKTDSNGKAFLPGQADTSYRICLTDTYYDTSSAQPATPAARYNDTCIGGATRDTATALTPTASTPHLSQAVTMTVAGQSLVPQRPWIVGLQRPGKTLTVEPGTWGPAGVALSYQWVAYDYDTLEGYRVIPGATGTTFVIPSDAPEYRYGVRVRGTLSGYKTADVIEWTGDYTQASPSIAAPLAITGTPTSGATLTATHGAVTPADSWPQYSWFADGVRQEAWGDTFTLGPEHTGKKISVRMELFHSTYATERKYSATTGSVFTTTPTPTTGSSPAVGKTITANPGTWAPVPDSFAYQWRRVATNGAVTVIAGATAKTYTPVDVDLGQRLQVAVTAAKAGHVTATTYSNPTSPVIQTFTSAPTPTRSGSTVVGQTLTGGLGGTWSPTPDSYAYQWLRDGAAIPGATGLTYQLTAADQGHYIRFRVTASKTGYATTTKTSSQTAAIRGTFTTVAPTISGTKTVGSALTATTGTWSPTPDAFAYKWIRVDSAGTATTITGATAASYVLTDADRGYRIRVTVTGTKTGYVTTSRSSALTTAIS